MTQSPISTSYTQRLAAGSISTSQRSWTSETQSHASNAGQKVRAVNAWRWAVQLAGPEGTMQLRYRFAQAVMSMPAVP